MELHERFPGCLKIMMWMVGTWLIILKVSLSWVAFALLGMVDSCEKGVEGLGLATGDWAAVKIG